MKKFLVYLCSIVVAVILGGVIGNLCVGIAPLSWLDYAPPLHLKNSRVESVCGRPDLRHSVEI